MFFDETSVREGKLKMNKMKNDHNKENMENVKGESEK